jgi:hypothetical protein
MFAISACAALIFGGVGCISLGKMTRGLLGLVPIKPATQLTAAFQAQIQYLPDPTQEGKMRAGIVGQVFLSAADGQYTEVDGDLTVMGEDITPRPPGVPPALTEIWHHDKLTVRKLKTKDERFGDCYALFLPYPPNWKDVTQIRLSTRYDPKPEPGTVAGPKLSSNPQVLTLDFSAPGERGWTVLSKNTIRPTVPAEIKAVPDVNKMIAQGKFGAPMDGLQPINTQQQVTSATTPTLPPPMNMMANPHQSMPGPNGSVVHTTAFPLPPGQTIPPGWTVDPNNRNALIPLPGNNPWANPPAAPNVPPADPAGGFRPAAPAAVPTPPTAPPPMTNPVGAAAPPAPTMPSPSTASAPLPAIPQTPMSAVPAGFDPNSPVGPWANTVTGPTNASLPPIQLPVPQMPPPVQTTVIPRR